MIRVSTDFELLEGGQIARVSTECADAWKDPAIPLRQWTSVVRGEVERYREGERQHHFDVLITTLKRTGLDNPRLLEVGASSAFYSQILEIGGFPCRYEALDYSEEYQRLAAELFPGVPFHVADATALPFDDGAFDVVLSGCCLIHIADYEKAIAETARVASRFAVFNRTPVRLGGETWFYSKNAYGIKTLEIHFGEEELLGLFAKHGLREVCHENTYTDQESTFGHRTYLMAKA